MKAKEKALYHYKAVAHSIVDGDTLYLHIDLGFSIQFYMCVRLLGINTPELRSKDPAQREAALKAKVRLAELTDSMPPDPTPLIVETVKDDQDKYGRYLARIYLPNGKCINDILLAEGLAVPMVG